MDLGALYYINIFAGVNRTNNDDIKLRKSLLFYRTISKTEYLGMYHYVVEPGQYCSIDPKIVKEYLNGTTKT